MKPKRVQKKAEKEKDPAAVALGRKGGLIGGKARMANLSPKERSALASKAGKAAHAALTAEERSSRARKAVLARWEKARSER